MNRILATSSAVVLLGSSLALPGAAATIGLVPDPDPIRHAQLVRGAELALAQPGGPQSPRLVVGRVVDRWTGVSSTIEALIDDQAVEVLVAPVDSRTAHLVAQIATRRHLPAIATAARGTPTTTGSWWLVTCTWGDRDAPRLAEQLGRPPTEWELAGFSAVRVARTLLDVPSTWSSPGSGWRDNLPASCLERETRYDERDG